MAVFTENIFESEGKSAMWVKQKISGSFHSFQGALNYAVIHSLADTARKNNQSPFFALKLIAQG